MQTVPSALTRPSGCAASSASDATVSGPASTTTTTAPSRRQSPASYQRVMRELLAAEQTALLALRNARVIDDNVMQRVQRDLDLETARLDQ